MKAHSKSAATKFTLAGAIITLGIVYGDLGTSPLYVMKAVVAGATVLTPDFIIGAVSCVIWTLTLQTTLKYIIITLRADNKGEGGIFSLYALIRRKGRWLFLLAIIGGATLLADGIITPSITVVSAVEGLGMINPQIPVIPIVLLIITLLFLVQQFGTNKMGGAFGPVMFFWFSMIGVLGLMQIIEYPFILKAFNPAYAFRLLVEYPNGFLLLGAVFLATTGAEALYSDLGHCGLKNIRISWIYVKLSLVLVYLGQGSWIILHADQITPEINPFFAIMPQWFLIPGILMATMAAIIASQALISGSYTLISEAILLDFWPKLRIKYPTNIKGQMYVPSINWFLFLACCFVIVFFQKSSNMESAYGLSITITMLMTTGLLSFYLYYQRVPLLIIYVFLGIYLTIEGAFLISNLNKFLHGGWFTILVASLLFFIMFVWYKGRKIKKRFTQFVPVDKYFEVIKDLSHDQHVFHYSTNLVYITRAESTHMIESKIMYSILNKNPKRADHYWFVHVDVLDEPRTLEYKVTELVERVVFRIDFRIGFKVNPRINLYFRQVVEGLVKSGKIDMMSPYPSLRKYGVLSDFKFIIIDRIQNFDFDFPLFEQFIMDVYNEIKKLGISDVRAYGLDTSNVKIEKVPLMMEKIEPVDMLKVE